MLAKFEKISSIGKFRDYSAKGDVSLKEFTLIYADNGSGKTTLAAIIRSLFLNDEKIIRNRLSDSHTTDQAVILTTKDHTGAKVTISFGKAGWKSTYDNVEIFDTVFVNENVYSGFDISEDHKKNLHQFVVGAQGVSIKHRIDKNKAAKEAKRKELDEFSKEIANKVANGLTEDEIKEFIKIKKEDALDIDNRIKSAQKELQNAQSQKALAKYLELPLVDKWTVGINFKSLLNDIQASSKTIKDRTLEKLFTKHIAELSENSMTDSEDWLRTGFDYVTTKQESSSKNNFHGIDCPFCQRELSNSIDILKAYTQLFDDDFNKYVSRLNSHQTKVSSFNLQVLIMQKNATKQLFKERAEFWKDYIDDNPPPFLVLTDSSALQKQLEAMRQLLDSKSKNPSSAKPGKCITDFEGSITQVNKNIEKLNIDIANYNSKIKQFKRKLKDPSIAEQELRNLQRIQKRFYPEIIKLCNSFVDKYRELKKLEDEYAHLSKDEELEANKFIAAYSNKINYYLKDIFGTPFQIKDMVHGSRKGKGRDAKVEYQLLLNGKPISFNSSNAFSVRDCLSEGDKSTIAFSFFLSKLEIDPKLADKILVYDDPLSSLDSNRRHKTVVLISDISKRIKQTIVLSHNESFLWELYKDYDASKRKALRIAQDFIDDASNIENLDIEYLVEHEYFIHITELENWLKRPDIKQRERIIGLIRNVLESHIKFKFYRQLRSIGPSKQTFGTCVEELERTSVPFRNNANRSKIIGDLRLLNAISCRPHHGGTLADPREYGIDSSKITDTELASFVKTTFDLIDNEI